MVNYGNGFTWGDVYHMPIHWRKFYFQLLVESKKKEKSEMTAASKKSSSKGPSVRVRK